MCLAEEIERSFTRVFECLGKPINKSRYKIIDRGVPHIPKSLPQNKMAVYMFLYNDEFLKIGKVGNNSNARFLSQHYNPNSSNSNLAKSILHDEDMKIFNLNEDNISKWIKDNCRRIDIILDKEIGVFALDLIEAVLHYKYNPKYEGFKTQRDSIK